MKKIMIVAAVAGSLTVGLLSGCTPGNNTPGSTVVGAAAGGLLAGALFSGSGGAVPGVIAGTLIGGSIGYLVGRKMDAQDQANMQSAIVNTPVNQQAAWTNQKTGVTYEVRPIKNYRHQGHYCRRYMTRIRVEGRWQKAYGRACRINGKWKVMS